ncbi:MAG TPA: asparagine synthase (glutamine-hydrolyzing) [Thermodesulfobacteriota bacterium]|nr:asparagine synthase (glutamine-hydrolyzing) [Thermodesulfobacteriota bacterium]
MCGICGFNWSDPLLAKELCQDMKHRGPDQEGVFSAEGITLGFRRLSIIDLSEQGNQPMANEDGSVQLVFNGEIYNFQDLRKDLLEKGHLFRGHSDSEVIVHAYEEWGREFLGHLRGMFAIGLWDQKAGKLLLARDRLGIKPLYYYFRNGRLAFASEIKSLLKIPGIRPQVNLQALYYYLGYEFVPGPLTMFEGISKLKPGQTLIYSNNGLDEQSYWDIKPPDSALTPEEAVIEMRSLLEDTVRRHLISDVPLGVFLSGGLDSSTLVALMRQLGVDPLRTFSIGYPDPSFSELPYAEIVARQFDTKHKVLMIPEVTLDDLEEAVWHLDEPMTDLSALPLYLVCREAKQYVTVCLSGEGGDEIFAGYDRFKASKADALYRLLPGLVREKMIYPLVEALPDQPQKKGAINILKRFIEGSHLPLDGGHLRWQYFSSADQDNQLFNQAFKDQVRMDPFAPLRELRKKTSFKSRIDEEVYIDLRFSMPDSVLMKVDKMSMAHALEIRVPFLDHRFVEFAASLPGEWKLKGFRTKSIFREALRGLLPDEIVWRGKQGYSLPIKNWLREGLKEPLLLVLKESPVIKAFMNTDYIQKLLEEHMARTHNHNHILWALLNLGLWHKQFFK